MTDPGSDSHDAAAAAPERALHAETRAIRAGRADNDTALAPILWATTTFVTPTVEEGRRMATMAGPNRFYSRYGNPTVCGFEDAIADLEGAESARAFASGMGAISAVVLGLCSKGDHIVAQRQLYAGTQLLLQTACPRFGIEVTFVDGTEPGALAGAVRPGQTTLVLTETPANPRLDLVDLDEVGAIAGPITVVDSTFATPLGPAAARPRRRPGGALGHQGHRRAQRRHPGRGGGQRRAGRVAVELRRAPRRERLALRRHERAARPAHAGGAAAAPDRVAPSSWPSTSRRTLRWPPCATRAWRRTPNTSWRSGRCR